MRYSDNTFYSAGNITQSASKVKPVRLGDKTFLHKWKLKWYELEISGRGTGKNEDKEEDIEKKLQKGKDRRNKYFFKD